MYEAAVAHLDRTWPNKMIQIWLGDFHCIDNNLQSPLLSISFPWWAVFVRWLFHHLSRLFRNRVPRPPITSHPIFFVHRGAKHHFISSPTVSNCWCTTTEGLTWRPFLCRYCVLDWSKYTSKGEKGFGVDGGLQSHTPRIFISSKFAGKLTEIESSPN
jgi:hypothetical protein